MTLIKRFQITVVLVMFPLAAYPEIPLKGIDESCLQEVNQANQVCGDAISASIKQCWQQRLSTDCFKRVEAGTGTQDPSCKQELQQAATPCIEASRTFSEQCMKKNLSQRCVGQLSNAGQILEKSMQACQEVLQRRLRICKTDDWKKETECLQRYQEEVDAACQR